MWFGKFAIIVYIFSVVLLAVGFMLFWAFDEHGPLDQGFPDCRLEDTSPEPGMQNSCKWEIFGDRQTQEHIEGLITNHTSTVETNPVLIFGDFIAAAQSIVGLVFETATGGVIGDILGSISIFGELMTPITIVIRILITFSGFCLLLYLISGREL